MDEVPATGKMATGQPGAGEPVEVAAEPGHNGASAIDRATSGQPDRYRAAPGSIPFRRLPARGPFPDVATEEPLSLKRNALWPKAAMNGSRPRPRSSARVLDLLNASWPDGLLTGPWPREAVNEPWPGSGRPGATPREATAEPARPGDRPAPAHPAEGDAPVGDPAVGAPAVGDPGEPAVELPWAMEESVHDLPEPVELP
ncbi:MAG TPA: hypothetical protein VES42_29210, partial [Pilimelia sp.]|nr:hypothetical protein [Pilimelia sp.]